MTRVKNNPNAIFQLPNVIVAPSSRVFPSIPEDASRKLPRGKTVFVYARGASKFLLRRMHICRFMRSFSRAQTKGYIPKTIITMSRIYNYRETRSLMNINSFMPTNSFQIIYKLNLKIDFENFSCLLLYYLCSASRAD